MNFEWDEKKRAANILKHGVDFVRAALIFEAPVLEKIDNRRDYGEVRWIALGQVDRDIYVLTYTRRGSNIRVISAWKGGRKEHEQYQKSIAGRNPHT